MKFILFLFVISCAGYSPITNKNPFAQYGISSLAITPVYNHSTLGNLSPEFTKQLFLAMSDFSDLKIENDPKKADATLVGLITSSDYRRDTRRTQDQLSAKSIFEKQIAGSRRDFFLPTKTKIRLQLKLMLVKKVSEHDLKLMKSDGKIVDPRVVLVESQSLEEVYDRLVLKEQSVKYLHTQDRGAQKNAIENMALKAANNFKEKILYAF